MVRVLHKSRDGVISYSGIRNPKFILTNTKGEFLFLSSEWNASRFQGGYFFKRRKKDDWNLYKIIDDICLVGNECIELRNNFSNFERRYANSVERFYFNDYGIIYEIEKFLGFAQLILDMREIYDYDDKGRIYKIYLKNDILVIEYTKYKDDSLKKQNYKLYLAIKGIKYYYKTDEWINWYYELDKNRKSPPFELYVYNALRVKVDFNARLCFSYSDNLNKAIKKVNYLYENADSLIKSEKDVYLSNKIKNKELRMAVKCATVSLNSFVMDLDGLKGIYAGLPWFFSFWSRDEAISIKALAFQRQYEIVKDILLKQLENQLSSGNIENRIPKCILECADCGGWTVKRLDMLITCLKSIGKLDTYFDMKTLRKIKKLLERSISNLIKKRTEHSFATNKPLATWMDTTPDGKTDLRDGTRIEIQALRLCIYAFMQKLCKLTKTKGQDKYKRLEQELKKKVRENFFKDNMLADGLNDFTVRPNIFLAYYIYPKLLSKKEWELVFENCLKKLWCEWGGLTTIEKESPLYQPYHTGLPNPSQTGENPISYHRGDSWFFVNHLAAISMLRVNRKKFMPYIKKIIEASTEDILKREVIGHLSELSSAEEQLSEGSPAQAWSAATFIELVDEFIK